MQIPYVYTTYFDYIILIWYHSLFKTGKCNLYRIHYRNLYCTIDIKVRLENKKNGYDYRLHFTFMLLLKCNVSCLFDDANSIKGFHATQLIIFYITKSFKDIQGHTRHTS